MDMKAEYQTITIADITLSAAAQKAICSIQLDEDKVICDNLSEIALRLSEVVDHERASRTLELVHSVSSNSAKCSILQ
jgi:hypothetical protein